jgi:hypothetical protein
MYDQPDSRGTFSQPGANSDMTTKKASLCAVRETEVRPARLSVARLPSTQASRSRRGHPPRRRLQRGCTRCGCLVQDIPIDDLRLNVNKWLGAWNQVGHIRFMGNEGHCSRACAFLFPRAQRLPTLPNTARLQLRSRHSHSTMEARGLVNVEIDSQGLRQQTHIPVDVMSIL